MLLMCNCAGAANEGLEGNSLGAVKIQISLLLLQGNMDDVKPGL